MLGAGCWVLRAVLSAGVLSAAVPGAEAQGVAAPGDLPDGDGRQVVLARCVSCHGVDLITAQRLTDVGWGREVEKMVRWGASVPEPERGPLVAYLARHFAPAPVASHGPAPQGELAFTRACLQCHGVDLTEQQRLSPAGWTREVEKMMRWGAQVTDAEKSALIAWLAARYPSDF